MTTWWTPTREQDNTLERLSLEHGNARVERATYTGLGRCLSVFFDDNYRCRINEDGKEVGT
jgi:hypothetical protein